MPLNARPCFEPVRKGYFTVQGFESVYEKAELDLDGQVGYVLHGMGEFGGNLGFGEQTAF